jgi:hypothetical protein
MINEPDPIPTETPCANVDLWLSDAIIMMLRVSSLGYILTRAVATAYRHMHAFSRWWNPMMNVTGESSIVSLVAAVSGVG